MSALQLASIFAVLADAAAKGTVILLVALGATHLMRRRSAAARHLVWVVALASMLALPLVTRVLPAWRVVPVPAPLRPATSFAAAPPPASPLTPRTAAHPADAAPSHAATPATVPAAGAAGPSSPALQSPSPETPFDWKTAMMVVWGAGGLLLAIRLAYGMGRVWWMERRAVEITDEGWVRITDGLARRLRVGRMVTLLREAHAVVPMTWGIVRPVVLLPADAEEWDTERRTVVLAHELAHVRRWDPLTQWIAHVSLALFWFHPLVWVAARRMREEREHACDDAVLSIGTRPVAYADHLLDIVRSLGQAEGPAAALAMARRSQFEGRLLAILDGATPRGGVSRGLGFAALVVAAAAVVPLAALRAAVPHAPAARVTAPASALASGAVPRTAQPQPRGVFARVAGNVGRMLDRARGALPLGGDTSLATRPAPSVPAPRGGSPLSLAQPVSSSPLSPTSAPPAYNEKVTSIAQALNVPEAKVAEMLQEGGGYADVIRAAEGIASSGDKAAVLLAVLRRPDVGQADQVLLLRAAGSIASSGDRAAVLKEFADRQLLRAPAVRAAWFSAASGLSSSGDRREVLQEVLSRPGQPAEVVSPVLASARGLDSSGDVREVLAAVLALPSLQPAQLVDVVAATGLMPSSGDRREALLGVLRRPALPADALAAVLRSVAAMPSPGDQRDVLVFAADHQRIDGAARAAYLATAGGISSGSDRATALAAILGPGAARAAAQPAQSVAGQRTETTHIHNDEDDGVWNSDIVLTTSDGSRSVRIHATNVLRGQAASDIRGIRPGGRLRLEETRNGRTRIVEMVPSGGALRATYTVDGQARAFDDEGRRWMNGLLEEFTRQ